MMSEEEKQYFLDEDARATTMGHLLDAIEDTDDPVATARAILTVMGTDLAALDKEIADWDKEVRERWATGMWGGEKPN